MTVIRVKSHACDDYFYVEADESRVQEAVDELTEEYNTLPEDERGSDLAEYILNGLDQQGLDTWRAGAITIDADWV